MRTSEALSCTHFLIRSKDTNTGSGFCPGGNEKPLRGHRDGAERLDLWLLQEEGAQPRMKAETSQRPEFKTQIKTPARRRRGWTGKKADSESGTDDRTIHRLHGVLGTGSRWQHSWRVGGEVGWEEVAVAGCLVFEGLGEHWGGPHTALQRWTEMDRLCPTQSVWRPIPRGKGAGYAECRRIGVKRGAEAARMRWAEETR